MPIENPTLITLSYLTNWDQGTLISARIIAQTITVDSTLSIQI